MTRDEKVAVVDQLSERFSNSDFFYIADSSTLPVNAVNELRALCFKKGIEMKVVKNTLIKKAFAKLDNADQYLGLDEALKGPTAIMFTDVSNAPAKLIQEFRKKYDRPLLKAAYIDSDIILGDDKIEMLSNLKSKDELLGDIILLLQSPMKNVLGSLNSGGQKLAGLLKALEERAN